MASDEPTFKKYTAHYMVEARPMRLGEYCREHWTTLLSEEKQQEHGFL